MAEIYYGWLGLGRDMNGNTLYSERVSWLGSNGWTDPGEVEAGQYLFAVLESEASEVQRILYPPPKASK